MLKELLEKQKVEIEIRKKKEKKADQRKINSIKQVKKNFSVYLEDLPIILSCIKHRNKIQYSKMKLAHFMLAITGLRVGNLKFLRICHLEKLFNKNSFFLTSSKTKDAKKFYVPYVKPMDKLVELVREDYNFIVSNKQDILESNKLMNLYDTTTKENINATEISELYYDIDTITKSLNRDLKKASILLNKELTTHSYRRGIANIIGRLKGIYLVKKVLNHTSMLTTEKYLDTILTPDEIKELMTETLKVNHIRNIGDFSFDKNLTIEKLEEHIEKILSNEN